MKAAEWLVQKSPRKKRRWYRRTSSLAWRTEELNPTEFVSSRRTLLRL